MAIIQITRSYSNYKEEGRVRAGEKFAIGKPQGEVRKVVSDARSRVLLESGLARVWDPSVKAPITTAPAPNYPGQAKSKPVSQPIKTATRAAAKVREEAPKAPTPLANPAGSRTGATRSPSSSRAAQASSNVPSPKPRGTRRSASSPSTTPTSSSDGGTSSTPATGAGGVTIKDARHGRV